MFETGDSAETIVRPEAWRKYPTATPFSPPSQAAIDQNPAQVQQYPTVKTSSWAFVGQVMRAMKGKANPGVVNQLVEQELDALKVVTT